jgi:hypothetical protein
MVCPATPNGAGGRHGVAVPPIVQRQVQCDCQTASPWKEALDQYLPECLELLAPAVHAGIDWSRGFGLLDTELAEVMPGAATGRRVVDNLARVWRRDGSEARVLVHVEAQHQRQQDFPKRMFGYWSRLREKFGLPVASVAILGDSSPSWRPDRYEEALWGCTLDFHFVSIKLLDFQDKLSVIEASRNPFASIVLAHLGAMATRRDQEARFDTKLAQVRRLYRLDYPGMKSSPYSVWWIGC